MSFLLAASLIDFCTLFSSLWTSKKQTHEFFLEKIRHQNTNSDNPINLNVKSLKPIKPKIQKKKKKKPSV